MVTEFRQEGHGCYDIYFLARVIAQAAIVTTLLFTFQDEPSNYDKTIEDPGLWQRLIWLLSSGFGSDANLLVEEFESPELWDDPLD